jgi:hypothetical protein
LVKGCVHRANPPGELALSRLPFHGFASDMIAATRTSEGNEPANPMSTSMEINRCHWDHMTDLHARENVYGIDNFKKGLCRLHRVEVEELDEVSSKTHRQPAR